jgi:uncharacterized protein (TIGR03437 family)
LLATSSQLVAGDFNGDGHPDLAVLVDGSSVLGHAYGLEILLGDGKGSFSVGNTYPIPFTLPLTISDIQHSGGLDLAAGFTVLLGHRDGTFGTAQSFGQYGPVLTPSGLSLATSHPGGIRWAAVGDFEGDGRIGLAGPSGDGTQLSILVNNTPGPDASANAVSAADYSPIVAPGSIASLFGDGLANNTAQATGSPWPTSLGGLSVRVLDAKGVERMAELVYVSPTQVNFLMPAATAYGFAIFNVTGARALPDGARSTLVAPLAQAFFTLDGTGKGPPAATAVRVQADGSQTPVPVAQCSATGACSYVPIDLSGEAAVYLSLYGTGFRQAATVSCYIPGSAPTPTVTYVGPQPTSPGLDQLNLRLPKAPLSGTVTFQCRFDTLPYLSSASFNIALQ